MFEITAEMDAYSRLALVLNDADMMKRVQARYESLRGKVFSSTGWVPETYGVNSDVGEVNDTAELIDTALNFAQFGWTQYYDDVERFTRGQLLPSQLMDTSYVTQTARPTSDSQNNIATRAIGAFGFPAPYGYIATKNPYSSGGYFTDVTGGAVVALADVKEADYSYAGGVHQINLLFDINNSNISVVSPYTNPAGERLMITLKTAGVVRIRLPSWANQTAIAASLSQQGLSYTFENGYVRITNAQVGTAFYVAMPLAVQSSTDTVNGRQIGIVWRGDSVSAMSSMGSPMPFFPNITGSTSGGSTSGGSTSGGSTSTGSTGSSGSGSTSTGSGTGTTGGSSGTVVTPPTNPTPPSNPTPPVVNSTGDFAVTAGSSQDDEGRAVAVDALGNSYVTGSWFYADGAADSTVTSYGDIYLAKFDASGNLLWQLDIGGPGDDRGNAIALDTAGNVYITGMFQKTVDFDPGANTANLTANGNGFNIFVAKYDTSGNYQWARAFGGASNIASAGYGIAVDSAGYVLVTGQFAGALTPDPTHPQTRLIAASSDIFVLKLAADGATLWAKKIGGNGADRATAITTDANNNIYLTGSYSGIVDFDPGTKVVSMACAGATDAFVLRLTANGDYSLVRRLGGKLADEGTSVAVDASGNIYVTGNFSGIMDVDPNAPIHNLVSAGFNDVFVAELNSAGALVFGERLGGTGDDRARDLVRLSNGQIAITGSFSSTVDFDPSTNVANATAAGSDDIFVLRLDAAGNYVSLTQIGESGADRGRGLAVDLNNDLYVVGHISGSISFNTDDGTKTITSAGGRDVFLEKLG